MRRISLAVLLLCAAAALPAQARQFHSSGFFTGGHGRVFQRQGSTTTGPGYYSHQGIYTGPGGRTASRDVTTSYGGGNYNRSVTYTGPNGNSRGYTSTGTYGATP